MFPKEDICANGDQQSSQDCDLSPMYVYKCIIITSLCENSDPQMSQEYDFSPVYVNLWPNKQDFPQNADPYTS